MYVWLDCNQCHTDMKGGMYVWLDCNQCHTDMKGGMYTRMLFKVSLFEHR